MKQLACSSLLALILCSAHAAPADTVYFGGTILTMAGATPQTVEALAVRKGRIVHAGSLAGAHKAAGLNSRKVDLQGKTLLPGFVDGHSHFSGVGLQAVSANLLPPPDGKVGSIAELQQVMRDFIASSPTIAAYGVAIGFNYDDSQLQEQRSPTAAELDAISSTLPLIVMHQSGHLAVFNSAALAKAGITAATPDPRGGVIRRKPGSQEPDGVLEENAFFGAVFSVLPTFSAAQGLEQLEKAQEIYAANGFTTVQDGRTDPAAVAQLQAAAKAGKLQLDVVSYADLEMNAKALASGALKPSVRYQNHLRLGGVKLTYDGSPQGKTAWFSKPYFQPPEGQPASYAGYPAFEDEAQAQRLVNLAYAKRWQLLVHGNGDAAIDQLIRTVAKARKAHPGKDRRTTLIHGQYLRADQVPDLKRLDIFPSLYPMHTFYWGDWHRDSVAGPERAENISPTGWLVDQNMAFSVHSDAPVTFPNSMRLLDSAVNRTTRSGRVLGSVQRLPVYTALQAMTIWPARQHFEEKSKGSLEVGKLADLIVLDANPLTTPSDKLLGIQVLETIKAGKTVYRAARP